jgi:hypothetical protein
LVRAFRAFRAFRMLPEVSVCQSVLAASSRRWAFASLSGCRSGRRR